MDLLDIHTHILPPVPFQSILNVTPEEMDPEAVGYFSVGIHPWSVGGNYRDRMELLKCVSRLPQVLAIGEAGLDKLSETDWELQEEVFEAQWRWAEVIRKPLIIHAVKSTGEMIRYKNHYRPVSPWVLHGFRGKKELARELVRHGFYLSFGERFNADAVAATPPDRIFVETDESTCSVMEIYNSLSDVLGISGNGFREQVQENVRTVFLKRKGCNLK